jgi:two-component system sensor histidine kinase DesK
MLAWPWIPPHMGKAPYLWSFALLFPLMKYFFVPAPALEVAAMVATVVLFLPMYFASYWARDGRSLQMIALTCLIGLAWTPLNGGVSAFFIYAAAMSAGITRPRLAYLSVVCVIALGAVAGYFLAPKGAQFLVPTLSIGLPVGLAAVMEATLGRSRAQLLRKQEEVEHMATIAERERISRDLHDLLGHTLSLITLKAELAGKLASRDIEACKSEIADIEKSARNALAEVRSAVTGYRLTGFAHELATARASLAAAGITLGEQVAKVDVPPAAENVMSLALREAVTNIIRHAGATRCDVSLAEQEGTIVLRIADNGSLRGDAALRPGNGLTGMKERVAAIGGRLALQAGQGLALELRLPMGARG